MSADIRHPPSNKELAERFGVSTRTVTRVVKRDPRWWTNYRRELRRKAAALHATGMTWKQVGEALGGVSESAARSLGKRGSGEWASGQREATDERQQDLPL
jgi:transposase